MTSHRQQLNADRRAGVLVARAARREQRIRDRAVRQQWRRTHPPVPQDEGMDDELADAIARAFIKFTR